MEEKQLVRRRHSQKDRRMVEIELEAAALQMKAKFNELIKDFSASLLVILSEEDRNNFTSTLEKMTSILFSQSNKIQDILSSLEEPVRLVLASQFNKYAGGTKN